MENNSKMEQETFFKLLRPPRLLAEAEPPAYFGENYSDSLPLFQQEPLADFEVYTNDSVKVITDRNYSAMERILKDNQEVRNLIEGKDYKYFGVRKAEHKRESENAVNIFYIYVYSDNYTVEVHFDGHFREITGVYKTHEQPAPEEDEISQAIAIARNDHRLAELITEPMVGQAILLSGSQPQDKNFGRRIFDIQFGYPEKRLPLYKAFVDMSLKQVISFRKIEQPKNKKEECHE
jgi:hypothetical protein